MTLYHDILACGDPRNVLMTINAIPDDYPGQINVKINLRKAEEVRPVDVAPAPMILLSLGLSPHTAADLEAGRLKAAHSQSTPYSRWISRLWTWS